MKRVVERCPNCGVEHDNPVGGECEVCGTKLRFWCRVHGPTIGFMDTAACPRCAEEAARPVPPPRPTPAPAPRREPIPTRVERDDAPPIVAPPRRGRPPPRPWGGWPRREPRVVIREHAEDLAPYAAAGASFAVRVFLALLTVLRTTIGFAFLGALIAFIYASSIGQQVDILWTALFGAMVGGGVGLFIGAIRGLRVLFAGPPRGPVGY